MPRKPRGGRDTTVVSCALCSKYFSTFALLRHMRDVHSSELHECKQCTSFFTDEDSLIQHCETDHTTHVDERENVEEARPKRRRKLPSKLRDRDDSAGGSVKTSKKSSGSIRSQKSLEVHEKSDGNDTECKNPVSNISHSSVKDSNSNVSEAVESTSSSPQSRKPVCPVCKKQTIDFPALTVHMLSHVERKKKVFACEECSAEFVVKDDLLAHKQRHESNSTIPSTNHSTSKSDVKETSAEIDITDVESTETSTVIVTGKKVEKMVFCVFCKQSFKGLSSLNEHRKEVHAQGPLDSSRSMRNCAWYAVKAKCDENIELMHPEDGGDKFCCGLCDYGPVDFSKLEEHRKMDHFHLSDIGSFNVPQAESTDTSNRPADKINDETWQQIIENAIVEAEDSDNLSCKICGQVFQSTLELREHTCHVVVDVTPEEVAPGYLSCPFCEHACLSVNELETHLQTSCNKLSVGGPSERDDYVGTNLDDQNESYKNQGNYKCGTCRKRFIDEDSLKLHVNIHRVENLTCRSASPSMQKLEAHTHSEGRYCCEYCGLIFRHESALENHTASEHSQEMDREIMCELCDEIFTDTSSMKEHVASLHSDRLVCIMCGKKFPFVGRLREHVRSVHIREPKHKCEECGDAFVHLNTFKNHMKRHRGEPIVYTKKCRSPQPVVCQICNKTFSSQSCLKVHKKLHQNIIYPCPFCPRKYTCEYYFNSHLKLHTTQPTIKCPLCDRLFRKQATLNEHVVSHTGDKSFFCDTCGFRTGTLSRLRKHQKSQHKNFKYQCWECPVQVNSNHGLVRHYMQHSLEFPYRCSFCQKLFIIEANAKRHIEFHMKKGFDARVLSNLSEIFNCIECGKQLRSFANLAVHLYTKHKKPKEELPIPPKRYASSDFSSLDSGMASEEIQLPVVKVPGHVDNQEIVWTGASLESVAVQVEEMERSMDTGGVVLDPSTIQIGGFPITILSGGSEEAEATMAVSQIMVVQGQQSACLEDVLAATGDLVA